MAKKRTKNKTKRRKQRQNKQNKVQNEANDAFVTEVSTKSRTPNNWNSIRGETRQGRRRRRKCKRFSNWAYTKSAMNQICANQQRAAQVGRGRERG